MATPYELGTSPHPPTASPSSGAKFGVFMLVVAALAAGAWFYISRRAPSDVSPESVANAETTPSPQPTTTGAPAAPTATSAAAAPARPGVTPTPTTQPRAPRSARSAATISATTTPPPPSPSPTPVLPAQPAAQPMSPAPAGAAPPSAPSVPPADPRIYDTATVDVTPPSLLTPIGIAPIRTNYVPGLATIEVIVSGDGSVLSARAGRAPASLGETLELVNWLSTAKSWRFGPAVKNGQPVKYRLVVPLSALVSGQGIR